MWTSALAEFQSPIVTELGGLQGAEVSRHALTNNAKKQMFNQIHEDPRWQETQQNASSDMRRDNVLSVQQKLRTSGTRVPIYHTRFWDILFAVSSLYLWTLSCVWNHLGASAFRIQLKRWLTFQGDCLWALNFSVHSTTDSSKLVCCWRSNTCMAYLARAFIKRCDATYMYIKYWRGFFFSFFFTNISFYLAESQSVRLQLT